MNKSVIVYGPQGCGKTRNADVLMAHFALSRCEDLDEPVRRKYQENRQKLVEETGVLYLTNRTREQMVTKGVIDPDARRVYSFYEAMYEVMSSGELMVHCDPTTEDGAQGLRNAGRTLTTVCHFASAHAGWWHDSTMGRDLIDLIKNPQSPIEARLAKALVAEKLCLSHSELSEAMEGHRKGLMDDKLPHRTMLEVELADAVIRIADLAGALDLDLGGAIAEKMAYNAVRPDHKKEAREAAGGKAY